ncbi:MAG: flagellar assembly regulator FliX [Xanthobacteraceae bacterium]|nr:MAG: flagellar assembly regulator FliX [Xanthobacteraceae bacterium]
MRIHGPNGTALAASSAAPRRAGATGFVLPDMSPATGARPSAAPKAVGNIDALMALQGVEDATERRKRAVKRGRTALDVLDDLKIGLLAGTLDGRTMERLRLAAADLKTGSGDPGLDAVLAEIELRVEVEFAKAGGR